jgi:hypothetical protein
MPIAVEQKPTEKPTWADQLDHLSKTDERARPWEAVVKNAGSDNIKDKGDIIDIDANPQGACDISVSA